jgi:hypothetical protein
VAGARRDRQRLASGASPGEALMARRPEPNRVRAVIERAGTHPILIAAPDGEKLLLRTVTMLLMHRQLQVGDRITIEAIDAE